jgi:hypothetical protein
MRGLGLLLLAGWILMKPPMFMQAQSVPITEWEQISAYDTAADCEKKREEAIQQIRDYGKLEEKRDGKIDLHTAEMWRASLNSRCIPADHIYPPKK